MTERDQDKEAAERQRHSAARALLHNFFAEGAWNLKDMVGYVVDSIERALKQRLDKNDPIFAVICAIGIFTHSAQTAIRQGLNLIAEDTLDVANNVSALRGEVSDLKKEIHELRSAMGIQNQLTVQMSLDTNDFIKAFSATNPAFAETLKDIQRARNELNR